MYLYMKISCDHKVLNADTFSPYTHRHTDTPHTHTNTQARKQTHTHARTHTHTHTHAHAHTYTRAAHTYTHTARARAHTHTHTHTELYRFTFLPRSIYIAVTYALPSALLTETVISDYHKHTTLNYITCIFNKSATERGPERSCRINTQGS